ncbi:nicotinate phosphoribosyltransferase [uncultured Thiodictyon sp.]|uniref:nicotinate phosphoribosyltransferase n=1 Tax=uncultured Thiodictyon sp. TaxID=1846217 RepID=UPI0025F11488|nr:nicotinate phosphoribosyltransferase [uncultured Thiodictyon sp.]
MPTADTCDANSALLTDLYQLTMLQAYFDQGQTDTAVFEFYVRSLPPGRQFLVAAGLEQSLDYLEQLRFSTLELDWLASCGRFHQDFVDSLAELRFTGDVQAMPEGTVFFPAEPILRIVAPLREAQLVETRLINLLQFETMIAAKAARVRLAAGDKQLVDFGMRRAHGAEAAMLSARASFLAGFDGSSNVLAGMRWGIPLFGTMAHSFIQAHDEELVAFEHFARSHPNATTLLIDTYDTEAAAQGVTALAQRLAADGITIQAVRIDSGDLGEHARKVRAILDAGGADHIKIFASSNLDEYSVQALLTAGAPIDGFGVGTRMNSCSDHPYLECAYKLQEYAGKARRKRSEGKVTWPGRKQVYRRLDANGHLAGDTLTLENDHQPGTPLLTTVMRDGRRLAPSPPLAQIRDYARQQLATLPAGLRRLDQTAPYAVEVAAALQDLARAVDAGIP